MLRSEVSLHVARAHAKLVFENKNTALFVFL